MVKHASTHLRTGSFSETLISQITSTLLFRSHLQRTTAELLPDRREAEDDMKVAADAGQEEVIEVLLGGWAAGELALHGGNEVLSDLIHLVPGKQVGDFPAG